MVSECFKQRERICHIPTHYWEVILLRIVDIWCSGWLSKSPTHVCNPNILLESGSNEKYRNTLWCSSVLRSPTGYLSFRQNTYKHLFSLFLIFDVVFEYVKKSHFMSHIPTQYEKVAMILIVDEWCGIWVRQANSILSSHLSTLLTGDHDEKYRYVMWCLCVSGNLTAYLTS